MAKSSPLNNVKKPTSDGCNVEHVVTDHLERTKREKRRKDPKKTKKETPPFTPLPVPSPPAGPPAGPLALTAPPVLPPLALTTASKSSGRVSLTKIIPKDHSFIRSFIKDIYTNRQTRWRRQFRAQKKRSCPSRSRNLDFRTWLSWPRTDGRTDRLRLFISSIDRYDMDEITNNVIKWTWRLKVDAI